MAVDHYENFPVASLLLPARMRPAVAAIYAFARSADDIADEGDATSAQRVEQLRLYLRELDAIEHQRQPSLPVFMQLAPVIKQYQLPIQPFRDLISAFIQDTGTTRYASYDQLLNYCERSANPVGRLMLHLFQSATENHVRESDAICTALQLINFWQDIAIDWQKQRVYLPQEDLSHFNLSMNDIDKQQLSPAWTAMMRFQTQRARELMQSGSALATRLPGRFGWELRLVIQGGLRILEKIDAVDGDVFRHRPVLNKADWLRMLWRAIRMPSAA